VILLPLGHCIFSFDGLGKKTKGVFIITVVGDLAKSKDDDFDAVLFAICLQNFVGPPTLAACLFHKSTH
jgi:hypothetical protein